MNKITLLLIFFLTTMISAQEIPEPTYINIYSEVETPLLRFSQGNKIGIVDGKGNIIVPCKFQSVDPDIWKLKPVNFPELFPVKQDGKWGYVRKGGAVAVPFQFDAVSCFFNEVAFIKKEGKYFAIDKKGEILNEKGYQRINGFDPNTGLAIVMEEPRKFGAINSKGEETIPVIYNVLSKAPGTGIRTYHVALDGKYGLINNKGVIEVPILSDKKIEQTYLGMAISYKTNNFSFLRGLDGKILLSKRYDNVKYCNKNICIIQDKGKEGVIDILTEEVLLPCEYSHVIMRNSYTSPDYFMVGEVLVGKGIKMGLVGKSNTLIFPIEYNSIHLYANLNCVILEKDGKFALGDLTGNLITPFEYKEIVAGKFAPFAARKNRKWGYIDPVGKVIYPFELNSGQEFNMFKNNQVIDRKNIYWDPYPLSDTVKLKARIYIGEKSFWLSPDGKITEKPEVDYRKFKIADNIFYVPNPQTSHMNMVNQNGKKILPYSLTTTFKESNGFIPFSIQRGKDGSIHREKDGFYFPSIKKYFIYEKVQNKFHKDAPIRWIKKDQKYGFIDKEANEITPIHFERIGHTKEGMISVFKDGKMGFIDVFGEMKIPMKFDDDRTYYPGFLNGVAYAFQKGKYGFINKKGETVAPFEFEAIAYFGDGVAIAYRNGKWEELVF